MLFPCFARKIWKNPKKSYKNNLDYTVRFVISDVRRIFGLNHRGLIVVGVHGCWMFSLSDSQGSFTVSHLSPESDSSSNSSFFYLCSILFPLIMSFVSVSSLSALQIPFSSSSFLIQWCRSFLCSTFLCSCEIGDLSFNVYLHPG